MTTGEKIKRIRQHRKMTQKELGEAIGLGASGANRIAQYEMGYRVPKKPLLQKMAAALRVSPMALAEEDMRTLGRVMETLMWLDTEVPGAICLTTMEWQEAWDEEEPVHATEVKIFGNARAPASMFPPTVMWTENAMLDGFLCEWGRVQHSYFCREITPEQYFEWKIQWPGADRLLDLYAPPADKAPENEAEEECGAKNE